MVHEYAYFLWIHLEKGLSFTELIRTCLIRHRPLSVTATNTWHIADSTGNQLHYQVEQNDFLIYSRMQNHRYTFVKYILQLSYVKYSVLVYFAEDAEEFGYGKLNAFVTTASC